MAEGKKSFVLYADYIHTFELLTNEQAGKLIKHLLEYVNDKNPEFESEEILLKIAFGPIKLQLKRDLKDWEETRQKRSDAGHLGGIKSAELRRTKQDEAKPSKLKHDQAKSSKIKPEEANQAVNVTVTVTDTDNTNTITNSDEFGDREKEMAVGVIKGKEKNKKAAPKKKINPDAEPYWKQIRAKWVWFNKTHLRFNVEPIPERDYSHIHRIIEKLRERATGQAVLWTEENALTRWEKFLTVAYTKDTWLHDNFLASNLEGKMQHIFKLIENPNGTHQQTPSRIKKGNSKSAGAELLIASLKEDLNAGRKQSN